MGEKAAVPSLNRDDSGIDRQLRPFIIRNLPNAITCVTVGCGFLLMASTSIPGISPQVCLVATACGLVADVLDGQVARMLRVKSKFGATFDQLADLTCFGIGPAIFFTRQRLVALGDGAPLMSSFLTVLAGYSYMACSAFRIARELIVHDGARPLYFVGIPTNLACCFSVPLSALAPESVFAPFIVLALSAMMVMPVKIPKGLGVFRVTEEKVETVCGQRKSM
uniref:CDP-diacylglycerol--serine O-phosphatidyltransferase n=1 Tax=Alexandrium catenella TaxID=2925 RepID=A0A7S1LT06_ALECA|mmetsp:Transcript_1317/g.3571  ORF Transcript_1317/g.3571 Transcript_1317/m.3571 type:complete len:223 (+) Transcript_1317:80-748(+)